MRRLRSQEKVRARVGRHGHNLVTALGKRAPIAKLACSASLEMVGSGRWRSQLCPDRTMRKWRWVSVWMVPYRLATNGWSTMLKMRSSVSTRITWRSE